MSDTVGTRGRTSRNPLQRLNSDGRPHPVVNGLTLAVLVAGLASFVVGMIVRNATNPGKGIIIVATVTGVFALLVGLYAQMVSATREQRVLIVTGIIAGFVGLALGLAHGGLG
ncbi:MAG TPA: hypothetical protein VKU39_17555 [Streptosporangiaceae bacterium]|nr:hypothetical protein [Streptosporangiaceae bacterium]